MNQNLNNNKSKNIQKLKIEDNINNIQIKNKTKMNSRNKSKIDIIQKTQEWDKIKKFRLTQNKIKKNK